MMARGNATRRPRGRQGGAALFVVMIMLMVMAWFGVSTLRLSGQNQQIVANTQARQHVTAAAQRAIEQTISSNLFTVDPAAVAAAPIESDVDGDNHPDFTAMLDPIPACFRVRTVKTAELDMSDPKDRKCLQSSSAGGTIIVERPGAPVPAGDSMCANTDWNIAARVDDARSGSAVVVNQGIAIRVAQVDALNYCK
jgi:type II secretory pathway pseudopilin PulG